MVYCYLLLLVLVGDGNVLTSDCPFASRITGIYTSITHSISRVGNKFGRVRLFICFHSKF